MLRGVSRCCLDRYRDAKSRLLPLLTARNEQLAREAFDRLRSHNSISLADLATVVAHCRRNGNWKLCVDVLALARESGMKIKDSWYQDVLASAGHDAEERLAAHRYSLKAWPKGSSVGALNSKRGVQLKSTDAVVVGAAQTSLAAEPLVPTGLSNTQKDIQIAPNPAFDRYCLQQGLVRSAAELAALTTALQQRPPTVVRVDQGNPEVSMVVDRCRTMPELKPLSWYPNHLAWELLRPKNQTDDGSSTVRTGATLANHWLRLITQEGFASFQSASSLLAPLLLKVEPGHRVADLCASPGSKTTQLLDLMTGNGGYPKGLVIANELDRPRLSVLRRRLEGKYVHVAVTSGLDAAHFPSTGRPFDRVLLDAQCSGEGHMQKDRRQWSGWHPSIGLRYHESQVKCLRRALELTAVGGRVVYSTCTLNPLENEAVVAAVLHEGCCELEAPDVPHQLRQAVRPGLHSWKVPAPDGGYRNELASNAPVTLDPNSADGLPLHLCVRIYPHQAQGMEAFFVAVLKKTRDPTRSPIPLPSNSSPLIQKPAFKTVGVNNDAVLKQLASTFAITLPGDVSFVRWLDGQYNAVNATGAKTLASFPFISHCGLCILRDPSTLPEGCALQAITARGARFIAEMSTKRVLLVQSEVMHLLLGAQNLDIEAKEQFSDQRRTMIELSANNIRPIRHHEMPEYTDFLQTMRAREDLQEDGPIILRTAGPSEFYWTVWRRGSQLLSCPDPRAAPDRDRVMQLVSRCEKAWAPKDPYTSSYDTEETRPVADLDTPIQSLMRATNHHGSIARQRRRPMPDVPEVSTEVF